MLAYRLVFVSMQRKMHCSKLDESVFERARFFTAIREVPRISDYVDCALIADFCALFAGVLV